MGTRTRSVSLLLLVALAALAWSHGGNRSRRDERELLVRSKRRWVLATIELGEEEPGPYPRVITQMTNDKREHNHVFEIEGTGVDKEPRGVFSIDRETGDVSVNRAVDREKNKLFHIKFTVVDRATGEIIDEELAFDVDIQDINDNAPKFSPPNAKVDVKENTPAGDLQVQLNVWDDDRENSPNSTFTVTLAQEPKVPQFKLKHIGEHTVRLAFEGCFDYDKIQKYEVILTATDHGETPLSSTAVVTVNIIDSNSHQPTFKKTQYQTEVLESTIQRDILRVSVEDKDSPQSAGWRAKYFFIAGNEGENYQLETDPETNEGILSVVKGMDFEKTTVAHLQIGVENEEPLFACKDKSSGAAKPPPPHTVDVKVTVIDVNDAPQCEKPTANLFVQEEEKPGKVLFTSKVHDSESDNVRFVLIEDPADWLAVDKETGQIKTTKKMDRESPFVDKDSVYKVTIGAVDDGKPPETGSCTLLIHMRDINDNTPTLVNKSGVMCGNKVNEVTVPVKDDDIPPYGGPFTFSLGGDDDSLKQRWKLDPAYGEEIRLVSLNPLPYGSYLVPLLIHDQQGETGQDTLEVIVCECGGAGVCRDKEPLSTGFGPAAIGLVFVALLLFLLLLLIFVCQCGKKEFSHIPIEPDEGCQSLMKYNQEAGGVACAAPPVLFVKQPNGGAVTDGLKQGSKQTSYVDQAVVDRYNPPGFDLSWSNSMGQKRRDTAVSLGGQNVHSTWMTNSSNWGWQGRTTILGGQNANSTWMTNSSNQRDSLRYQHLHFRQFLSDHIQRQVQKIDGNHDEHDEYTTYLPRQFAYEGESDGCQSLDQLSLSNLGDDLQFLDDLGPGFKTLGDICQI